MECVAYMRVSTEKQAEEGNGLDSQKRDILAWAGKNEFVIKEWYVDDGYTGSNMNRPALQRLISDCYAKKIKNVIAFKLDRLSRSMIDGLYIIEKIFMPNGVTFKCVHDSVNYDSPMEQAYTQMMAVFAQLDKNTMMLRMRGGMLERVKQGYWPGGGRNPKCYNYNSETGILEIIPEEAEKANAALDMYIAGATDKEIQETFGYSTESLVPRILTSVANIGMIPYKGEVYQGLHQPVFTKEKYELGLSVRESRKAKRYVKTEQLLTGLLYCGDCGCAMRYQKWNNGNYRIYCCSRNKSLYYLPNHNTECKNELYWASDIDKQVEDEIKKISLSFKPEDVCGKESALSVLNKQLDGVKSKLKRLYGIYADGNDTVVEMISELESKAKELREKIAVEESKENRNEQQLQYEKVKKIADVWDHIDKKGKNQLLKSIVDKIIIVNGDIEIRLKNYFH